MRSIAQISPSTQLCAVIGNPVAHSLSPALHNRAFQELGLDFVYLAFRVENLGAALAGMRAFENFRGLSVTIPHKVEILGHLDEISEVDQQIGSINTVVNEGGKLRGFGSDGPGARQALLESGVEIAGQPVLVLGSGGAARAISFDLAHRAQPSSLFVLGEIEAEIETLVSELREKTGVAASGELLTDASLERRLAETRLLGDARARGLEAIPGFEMFLNQAILQFEAWTGESAPAEVMRQVVLEHLAG